MTNTHPYKVALVVKNLPTNSGDPGAKKIPWRRKWEPTPVFLPGESHGQRILVGYSPWGRKELDTTKVTQHAHTQAHTTPTTGCRIVCEGWRWGVCWQILTVSREESVLFSSVFHRAPWLKKRNYSENFPAFLPRGLMDSLPHSVPWDTPVLQFSLRGGVSGIGKRQKY